MYWFVSTVGFYSLSRSIPGLYLFSLFPCLQPVFVCYVLCFIRSSVLSCFPSLNLLYPLECVMETWLVRGTGFTLWARLRNHSSTWYRTVVVFAISGNELWPRASDRLPIVTRGQGEIAELCVAFAHTPTACCHLPISGTVNKQFEAQG